MIMKQARKEERRQARRDKGDGDDGVDQETYLRDLGFDPEMLAAQR